MPGARDRRSRAGAVRRRPRRRWPLALAAAELFAHAPAALANPVNTERSRIAERDDGWTAVVDARIAFTRGNVERVDASANGGLIYRTLHPEGGGYFGRTPARPGPRFVRHRWILLTNQSFVQVRDRNVANAGFAHSRYTWMVKPRLGAESFFQVQYNEITLLKARIVGGLGGRVVAIHRPHLRLAIGTGYMPEFELNDTVPGDPHPARVVNHRWSSLASVHVLALGERLAIQHTAYVQPRFDRFGDVRVLSATQLEGRLGDGLSLGIEFDLIYDRDPPQTVRPLDAVLASFLRVRI